MVKRTEPPEERGVVMEFVNDLTTANAVSAVLAELGLTDSESVTIQARLITPDNPRGVRVYDSDPATFDLMNIAREFGSGKYQIILRGPSEEHNGKVIILKSAYEQVRLTHAEEQSILLRGQSQPIHQPQQPLSDPAQSVIAALAPTLQAIASAMANRPDPMEQMRAFAEVFRAMQPPAIAPVAVPVAAPDPIDGLTSRMAKIAQLKMVKEIMGDIGGVVGDDGELAELLGSGGGMLKDILALARETKRPPEKDVTPQSTEDTEMNMVGMALGMLESAAKKGKLPESMAQQITPLAAFDVELPNGTTYDLETVLRDEKWWNVLTHFRPSIAPYKDWIAQVRAATIKVWDTQDAEGKALTDKKKRTKSG